MTNGRLITGISYEEYSKIPAVSITRLKELSKSGLHYKHVLESGLPETDALRLGIAAHTATLEPERFESQFAVWRRRGESGSLCPRKGQYWETFCKENPGKQRITEDDEHEAKLIASAARDYSGAYEYLSSGCPEVSLQWETWVEAPMGMSRMVPCRGRIDWLCTAFERGDCIVGLKTARDVRELFFGTAAYRLGYHMQWAFYFDAYVEICGVEPYMKEIVVQSSAPYDVVVYNITQDIISQGRDDYRRLLQKWVECEYMKRWPGVADGHEIDLTLPSYAYPHDDDDISELEFE